MASRQPAAGGRLHSHNAMALSLAAEKPHLR